jgi:hypothetical protein
VEKIEFWSEGRNSNFRVISKKRRDTLSTPLYTLRYLPPF